MNIGTILHHKYFNGVVGRNEAIEYQKLVRYGFKHFGMFGTGMLQMVVKYENGDVIYDFSNVDRIVKAFSGGGNYLHYNTVITGRLDAFPQWFKGFSKEEKLLFLESHVRKIVSRYRGLIDTFKLVNEAVREEEENYLGTGLNKSEVLTKIFKWAVDENPKATYMINEFGSLVRDEIREKYILMIKEIVEKGGRIDIVGVQGHLGYYPKPFEIPSDELLNKAFDNIYEEIQLPISVTEFDLSYRNHTFEPYSGSEIDPKDEFEINGIKYPNWYKYQGYAYTHFIEYCKSKEYIESVYFWSFVDDPTLTHERIECGLVDKDFKPKVIFATILEGIN